MHLSRKVVGVLLQALAWPFYIAAALTFWAGGRAICEFYGVERVLAEFIGLFLAFVLGALGFLAKSKGEEILENKQEEAPESHVSR